jgi:hypothetical protein
MAEFDITVTSPKEPAREDHAKIVAEVEKLLNGDQFKDVLIGDEKAAAVTAICCKNKGAA